MVAAGISIFQASTLSGMNMGVLNIEFLHVFKEYRRHFWERKVPAVVDCSFSVEKNSITGFVGPNGAGKTTCIKMLLGLIKPTAGKVMIHGQDPRLSTTRKGLSFLSERPYFYDHLTVLETLRFSYRLVEGYATSGEKDIARALETVELSASINKKVKDLSKGMQQRLAMAQALLCNPDLLILDEPMSGLDPLGRRLFRHILLDLGKAGKTIFFSSHILDDVEFLCSHVVVMAKGHLQYQGRLSQLLAQGGGDFECVVNGLAAEDRNALVAMGVAVTRNPNGGDTITIPGEKKLLECQHYLWTRSLVCESVTKRTASLEDIIYKKN
jgi:ABC-2 type transport system ATP-binding protein